MQQWKKNVLALSIIPQILFVKAAAQFPSFIETYYSNGFYPLLSKGMRFVFGWIPFSVGDIFYTFLGVYAIRWLIIHRKRVIKEPLLFTRDVFIALSLVYFTFHVFWGMNYYREPLHKSLNLQAEYTTEELQEVVDLLTKRTNELQVSITNNDSLTVQTNYSKSELLELVSEGFKSLQTTFPHLDPSPSSTKKSLYSWPLTYMGFGGYLNPISHEAQINTVNLPHKMPTTATHEKSHQIGYAAENEANFIACLATINHPDTYFQYCGSMFALKHCLIELNRRDTNAFDAAIDKVNIGIRKHYQEESEFWKQYQNPLEPLFKSSYNQFLKANNQQKGIDSYSYVVALLVNHFKRTK